MIIHTVLSQQPGCVVDPSYVINESVFGRSDLSEMCLTGSEEPAIIMKILIVGISKTLQYLVDNNLISSSYSKYKFYYIHTVIFTQFFHSTFLKKIISLFVVCSLVNPEYTKYFY